VGWWQEGHPAVKTLATKHDLRRYLRVPLLLPIMAQCVNSGGERVRPVGRMRGGSVVGQTVKSVLRLKKGRFTTD